MKHDVHINFWMIKTLFVQLIHLSHRITSHNHVFPRRFIRPYRRQPNPSHQATSRTRSRRRKRKTARRGNHTTTNTFQSTPFAPVHLPKTTGKLTQYTPLIRNSTNTASNAVSPNLVLRCPRASRLATLNVWKNTCLRGMLCPSNTSIASRERLVLEASWCKMHPTTFFTTYTRPSQEEQEEENGRRREDQLYDICIEERCRPTRDQKK
jgi:hypothetical protein